MTRHSTVRRTAGLGLALMAALGLSACGGEQTSTPTATVTVTQTPEAAAPSSPVPAESAPEAATSSSTPSPSDTPSATSDAAGSPSGSAADPGDPFGGMGAVSGTVSGPAACDQIGEFRANLPSNVEKDPEGARDAVAKLQAAAPQELRGNLQGLKNILDGYVQGHKPIEAVEGKTRGLINQCQNLANG